MHKIEVQFSQNLARFAVSLFTREWIEIAALSVMPCKYAVSLFTREWIEITSARTDCQRRPVSLFTREWIEMWIIFAQAIQVCESPSLRGSGLKSIPFWYSLAWTAVSLFTREWIEVTLLNL